MAEAWRIVAGVAAVAVAGVGVALLAFTPLVVREFVGDTPSEFTTAAPTNERAAVQSVKLERLCLDPGRIVFERSDDPVRAGALATLEIQPSDQNALLDLAGAPDATGYIESGVITLDLPRGGFARATLTGLSLRPRDASVLGIRMRLNGYGDLSIGGITPEGREKVIPVLPTEDFALLRVDTVSIAARMDATQIELAFRTHDETPVRLEISTVSLEAENAGYLQAGAGLDFLTHDVPGGRVLETASTGIHGAFFDGPGSVRFKNVELEGKARFFSRLLLFDDVAGEVNVTLEGKAGRQVLLERTFPERTRELFLTAPIELPAGFYDLAITLAADERLLVGMNPMLLHGEAQLPHPRHIIVYVADATRADHLPVYGYERMTAPYLNRLSRDSLVVERSYTAATYTKSSVPSVLTSLYASNHRVFALGHSLPDDVGTFFQDLQRQGYVTVLAHQGPNPGPQSGLHRDADLWLFAPHGGDKDAHGFAYLNDRVLELFDEYQGVPLAVYLHNNGPHSPWEPSAAFDVFDRHNESSAWGHAKDGEGRLGFRHLTERADIERVEALYDADVLQSDLHYGSFVERLAQRGLLDNSLLFFTSDHGDTLHDDYPDPLVQNGRLRLEHGTSVHDSQARIPMIITAMGLVPPGRMDGLMMNIDIFPTALGLLGLSSSREVDGVDLSHVVRGAPDRDPERIVFVRGNQGQDARIAAIQGRLKLILNADAPDTSRLVDPRTDHYEGTDVRAEHAARFERLLVAALDYRAQELAPVASSAAVLDAENLEALQNLGYLE